MSINDFGLLSFGFSFGTLLATCLDFGQSLMIMKDYPQQKFQSQSYVLNSLAQKVVFIIFFGAVFLFYLNFFYNDEWVKIGNRFILFAVLSAYVLYLQAFLRVKNRFRESAITIVVYALVISTVVLLFYYGKLDLLHFITLMIFGKLVQLLVSIFMCIEIFQKNWFNIEIQRFLIKNSWSFGAHFIFGTFYFTIDTQIIALLLEAKDVALYQSVFRIIYIFLIVSDVASNVLLPYLSSKYANKEDIDELSSNILYLLLIIGSGLFLLFTLYHKEIIAVLYTDEYKQAYPLVLPLSIVIILRTAASIYGTLLTISNNQVNRVKVVFISMLFSIVLNFVLIPKLGIIAAAWTSVAVHIILFGGYYFYSKKEFPKIGLITKENLGIMGITALIFILSNILLNNSFIYSSLFFVLWCFLVVFLLKKHQKSLIISRILKDKGVM